MAHHEIFRKVTMKKPVEDGQIYTPAGAGNDVQYLPAAQADAMRETELGEQTLPVKERQRLYFKNGIEKIGKAAYYAHSEMVNGQNVTVMKTDEPETPAVKAAATAQAGLDVNALGLSIGQGIAAAMKNSQDEAQAATAQASQDRIDQATKQSTEQTPAPVDAAASEPASLVVSTTENNLAALDSPSGAVNPVAGVNLAETQTGGTSTSTTDSTTSTSNAQTDAQGAGLPAGDGAKTASTSTAADVQTGGKAGKAGKAGK